MVYDSEAMHNASQFTVLLMQTFLITTPLDSILLNRKIKKSYLLCYYHIFQNKSPQRKTHIYGCKCVCVCVYKRLEGNPGFHPPMQNTSKTAVIIATHMQLIKPAVKIHLL